MQIFSFFDIIQTKIGSIRIEYSANGIKKIILPRQTNFGFSNKDNIYIKSELFNRKKIKSLDLDLVEYFEGKNKDFSRYHIDLSGFSDFAKHTLNLCRKIPYGETKSYQWIAENINSPLSYRAVGQALARNPCPIIIPCHRIVSKQGKLTGYGGKQNNIALKKFILNLESCF